MDNIQELYNERVKLVEDQRAILNKAKEEERDISAEEETAYETMGSRFDELSETIKAEEEKIEKRKVQEKELEDREEKLKMINEILIFIKEYKDKNK